MLSLVSQRSSFGKFSRALSVRAAHLLRQSLKQHSAPRASSQFYRSASTSKSKSDAKVTNEEKARKALNLSLIVSASEGDIAEVKRLIEECKVDINTCDHDGRTALHLAAAEGRLDIVKYLLSKNANINGFDRFHNTPLDDAVAGRKADVIKHLKSEGAHLGRISDSALAFCREAGKGNITDMQMFLDAGVDLNGGDYDNRTPLHLASSEGQVQAVEWLVKQGARVNSIDRFGNTPLQDAERGRGRNFRAVVQILKENGATHVDNSSITAATLISPLLDALPLMCDRHEFVHAEAYIPIRENSELELLTSWTDKDFAEKSSHLNYQEPVGIVRSNDASNFVGRAYSAGKGTLLEGINTNDFDDRAMRITNAGIKTVCTLPIKHGGKTIAVLALYSCKQSPTTEQELAYFDNYSSGLVLAGVYGNSQTPIFCRVDGVDPARMNEVYKKLVNEGVFSAPLVYNEVDWFFNMGVQQYYLNRCCTDILANHIHSFIAAKQFAKTTGNRENIWLHIENNEKLLGGRGPEQVLFMVPFEHTKLVAVERHIQTRIASIPHNKPYSFEFFTSDRPFVPRGQKRLAMYLVKTNQYANPTKVGSKDSNIWEVASDVFLADKSKLIRERYQEIIQEALQRLSPVCKEFPVYRDGTIPLMFAFSQGAGTSTSYMLQLTELMNQNGLSATRKFIETFANGVIVFSLYLEAAEKEKIDRLFKQFSMLHLVPQSALTPLFLSGEYSAEQYTYCSAAFRFIYYFINQRSEEFDTLAKVFANDPLNLSRLRLLNTTLKREAVSQTRIIDAMTRHPKLVDLLFDDFEARVTGQNPTSESIEQLRKKIKGSCYSDLDAQIFNGLVNFNLAVLKTNFYKPRKSALSFRLDTSIIFKGSGDWPQTPYGLFFLMGSDFQGFHIRFQDIARGGIRLIASRDQASYNRNLATLFAENYGLAYTQNKKNKDIPEFGSKGTVLLNMDSQGNRFLAFQKYCSGVLDVLASHPDIYDRYGKQELLFFGPDEGTADYMEWAAKYAKVKNYPYWRSFTTGKPVSIGGIPHDLYGMTTRSVHKYVIGCLNKLGLDETQVTKLQTGGPDGDLGSNEILLSKDRTKAVIDGSGVVYDPDGLNRQELSRLATERKMIEHFDVAKLGQGGFRVLINESNVTLPNGEVVENGLAFRNEFHLHPLAEADLFVPCGGRPEAVNLGNVRRLFDEKGKPRFKIIVEGANLFFTQDARMVLEDAGVILYKDASANKGGVTSSSLEVLAALSLNEEQFTKHMCVTDPNNIPPFYAEYVKEIQGRIEKDAELEFECIWREHERSKIHRYLLTDMVSDKINELNLFITASPLFENLALRRLVLAEATPRKLQELIGIDAILQRVPESYLRAIFGAYLASRYIYKYGIRANEFAFFEFMQPFLASKQ